ncbi:hypothetical protein [Humidesulfovibrio idahonensis]
MNNPPRRKNSVITGQDCPQSGVWQAQGVVLPPLLVAEGSIMPAAGGRVVTWLLLETRAPQADPST